MSDEPKLTEPGTTREARPGPPASRRLLKKPERTDYTNPVTIGVGLAVYLLFAFMVPPFLFLLPFVIVFLLILYMVSAGNLTKARQLAKKHLCGAESSLYADFAPGMSEAMVVNDWGIVIVKPRTPPWEFSWDDVKLIEERSLAMLTLTGSERPPITIDLSQDNYFQAAEILISKIPKKCHLSLDPVSGESKLLTMLDEKPFEWKGRWGFFKITASGVEHKDGKMSWDEIDHVTELDFETDETNPRWDLQIHSRRDGSIKLSSNNFGEDRQIGDRDYDLVKLILEDKLGAKRLRVSFQEATPRQRAKREFDRCQEATKAALSFALKSGKTEYLEKKFYKHMLNLLDRFSLEHLVDAASFLTDYADLMRRADKSDEAERLDLRCKQLTLR